MPNAHDVIRITTALKGTKSAPHFDRTAFKVRRTYATLAADGLSINLKLFPEEQELKCLVHPKAFTPRSQCMGQARLDNLHTIQTYGRGITKCSDNGMAARYR